METLSLTTAALEVIDGYKNVRVGQSSGPVPYFNNRSTRRRMALRAYVGKGSPKDIHGELEGFMVKHHVSREEATQEVISRALVDAGLGIDCSGFAYYVLDAESKARGRGHINGHISFVRRRGPFGRMISYLRPAENCDVRTLASDVNSRQISLEEARPGDFISFLGGDAPRADRGPAPDRDHILVITSVELENGKTKKLSYAHAIAYPEDGLYGTGIKEGTIDITGAEPSLLAQTWSEGGLFNDGARYIFSRAQNSKTELRRLKWL